MLDLAGGTTVYLACGVTDLRKSYNGLAAIIKLKFHLDPYSHCMFAFCNRRRTSIKILQWDGSGFWILMKKLDRNSFHRPDTSDELQKVDISALIITVRKNFAVGRRNLLFAKSIRGADASAITYSIVETALLNGLKPYLYLTYVLERLRQLGPFPKPEELDSLLPWAKELPEEIKTKTKPKK